MLKSNESIKERILKDIEEVPESKLPRLYKIIHLLTDEFIQKSKKTERRGSLKGIWKGSQADESLFTEAKKSLFPYEGR